jgi:hypothetical protein
MRLPSLLLALSFLALACGGTNDAQNPNGAAADVATSPSKPPWGIWSISVMYGPPGEAVSPTPPVQVELRPDGTAYSWTCAGAAEDGSIGAPCGAPSRTDCLDHGSVAWNGTRWHVTFPASQIPNTPEQGDISPDGKGDILVGYILGTYSGGLFRRVADATSGGASCSP